MGGPHELLRLPRLTTPHIDRFAAAGRAVRAHLQPPHPHDQRLRLHAHRHGLLQHAGGGAAAQGPLTDRGARRCRRSCGRPGYDTTCVGFSGNPSSRGFDKYLELLRLGKLERSGRSPKAENLNKVAIPELERLAGGDKPFFLFLRHMDPHAPYLPPDAVTSACSTRRPTRPEQRLDGAGDGVQAVLRFLRELDAAGHHGQGLRHRAVRRRHRLHGRLHPDASSPRWRSSGFAENTLVVLNGDHGETLYDHECYFDHHGMYDCTLHVPLIMRLSGQAAGRAARVRAINQHQDLVPTLLELLEIETERSSSTARACCRWSAASGAAQLTASSTSPSAPGCASTAGARRSGS